MWGDHKYIDKTLAYMLVAWIQQRGAEELGYPGDLLGHDSTEHGLLVNS